MNIVRVEHNCFDPWSYFIFDIGDYPEYDNLTEDELYMIYDAGSVTPPVFPQ